MKGIEAHVLNEHSYFCFFPLVWLLLKILFGNHVFTFGIKRISLGSWKEKTLKLKKREFVFPKLYIFISLVWFYGNVLMTREIGTFDTSFKFFDSFHIVGDNWQHVKWIQSDQNTVPCCLFCSMRLYIFHFSFPSLMLTCNIAAFVTWNIE